MIIISHRLFLWTIRAGRDSHALHRDFEQSEKSFSFAVKRCICEERKTGNPSSGNLREKSAIMTQSLMKPRPTPSFRAEREIFFVRGKADSVRKAKNGKPFIRKPGKSLRHTNHNAAPAQPHIKKTYKKQLTQERQCGKKIPLADEAAPFERAMKKISKKSFDKPLRMW